MDMYIKVELNNEQFGKDLANPDVSDLSQLKWVFDGKKVPADFKSKMLEEIKKL